MDINQARELYSAYYEGTIERVSAVALDEAMKGDADIRDDFASFSAVMDTLPTLAEESVSTPTDLHDKIMARLDHHEWEKKQGRKLLLFSNPKMAWFGAAAAALLIFGGLAVLRPGTGTTTACIGVCPGSQVDVNFTADAGTVRICAIDEAVAIVIDAIGAISRRGSMTRERSGRSAR